MKIRIAVIGAGLAGVTVARELSSIAEVKLFEKARGLGGRMATRRAGDFQFDHGAQFFTARSQAFQEQLEQLDDSVIQAWNAKVVTLSKDQKTFKRPWYETHYVAVPQMNSLAKHIAAGLDVATNCRVAEIKKVGQSWHLLNDEGQSLGDFHWVICAAPAPQTLELLPEQFAHAEILHSVRYSPCFALLLGFDDKLKLNFDAALVRGSAVAWLALNHSKPGRSSSSSLIVQSDNHWAQEHLDDDDESVSHVLMAELEEFIGITNKKVGYQSLHRWRYARVESELENNYLLDTVNQLAACGDWCQGNRVEDAFLSGQALANELATRLAV